MARKPTGRPLGRPTLYSDEDRPVTVSLRIPRDLHTQLMRYAARHRQTVSELVKDGLEWRLDQDDPRYSTVQDFSYYDNTVLQELAKPAYLVDERIPFDDGLLDPALPTGVHSTETPALPAPATAPHEDTLRAAVYPMPGFEINRQPVDTSRPEKTHEAPQGPTGEDTQQTENGTPDYDTSKYSLGKLCPRGHEHGTTGQSLLRISNRHCLDCDREKFHERGYAKRRQTRRQAQSG